MQDIPETTGERLARAMRAHGLAVSALFSRHGGGGRIVVDIEGGGEIWITGANGQIDRQTGDHFGWGAVYRPYGERSGEGETRIYESTGTRAAFERDTAALIVAVVQCAAARRLAPA
ncbi:hypothetical protein [Streptomyces rubradiris]|uniref:Uncharacterized protein n=1 Tax=Streptomyces rubradiris TaxID=285531 RepID=A0ABQ3RAH3_STRRR|nr:hypothetical protein [Streptomyces rubradiris]GHH31488.1 hypothetical protein GCM10018792_79280 [Streptomyces rubradiris]GHI52847.1 hypothetical protein Srubr_26930 [Streptomyces rubradiris]GHI52864.1 hypothetical protein Srubr_27100 [Streptomyces rubradiris]